MEMAGIVCLTGASIIQMARKLIDGVGRPLELDTDGIWCILPQGFPENVTFQLANGKKMTISYPCTMLNHLVHDKFTNDQYEILKDRETFEYERISENSIFFEVDGPYHAMILPASTEEGKLLKKRYAVFNHDGSLAELKGFEVKRRGELKLIKIFQSQLFKVFLHGTTLEGCYQAVGEVANQWLNVITTKGQSLKDAELFELISENRSMSKALQEYGTQKSTSISTAKRLAEFLGDQMVKEKGLACKFIIVNRPKNQPVSERAIPIAIFSAEHGVKQHFLRKWLKDGALLDFDIRGLLDWDYYLERMGAVIQKLITIPAAMQNVTNPVPRIKHPDWLGKKVRELTSTTRQRKLQDFNYPAPMSVDMEDMAAVPSRPVPKPPVVPVVPLDNTMDIHDDYSAWLDCQKKIWKHRLEQHKKKTKYFSRTTGVDRFITNKLVAFIEHTWHVLDISPSNEKPGEFNVWAIVQNELHVIKLAIPREFYINCKTPDFIDTESTEQITFTPCASKLPRNQKTLHLYKASMSEEYYEQKQHQVHRMMRHELVQGVYGTQQSQLAKALVQLGATCNVKKRSEYASRLRSSFVLDDLEASHDAYLTNTVMSYVFVYQVMAGGMQLFGLFFTATNSVQLYLLLTRNDSSRTGNVGQIYQDCYQHVQQSDPASLVGGAFPYAEVLESTTTQVHHTADHMYRAMNASLAAYKKERHGITVVAASTFAPFDVLQQSMRTLSEFPRILLPSHASDNAFHGLDWQRNATKRMMFRCLSLGAVLNERIQLAKYAHVPLCSLPQEATLFILDMLYARKLLHHGMVLWWSPSAFPDLGGLEDDATFYNMGEELMNPKLNAPGFYGKACADMDVSNLFLSSLLESTLVNELEGSVVKPAASLGMFYTNKDRQQQEKQEKQEAEQVETMLDGGAVPYASVAYLRDMVRKWHSDATNGNAYAALLTSTFYQWISNCASCLYDPVLFAHLHGYAVKSFMQLITNFKKIGSQIIYADFDRLVICTPKNQVVNAQAFVQYAVQSIQQKSLFKHVQMDITAYREHVYWLDATNFGCITQMEDGQKQVGMQWSLKFSLPKALQPHFDQSVAEFIYLVYQHVTADQSDAWRSDTDASRTKKYSDASKAVIQHTLAPKLLALVAALAKESSHAHGKHDWSPPALYAQHDRHLLEHHATPYVVRLVIYLCHIMNLCSEFDYAVRTLKRGLLSILNITEFSDDASYKPPSNGLILSRWTCTYCHTSRDIDLCNDADFILDPHTNQTTQQWTCSTCDQLYDKAELESRLIDQLHRLACSYQLQDTACIKCKSVKRENMAHVCTSCASASGFSNSLIHPTDMSSTLKLYAHVCTMYGFQDASEYVHWLRLV
jgi:DNA polymerase epsilon subunit 1